MTDERQPGAFGSWRDRRVALGGVLLALVLIGLAAGGACRWLVGGGG